jgi:hypothetical protein
MPVRLYLALILPGTGTLAVADDSACTVRAEGCQAVSGTVAPARFGGDMSNDEANRDLPESFRLGQNYAPGCWHTTLIRRC